MKPVIIPVRLQAFQDVLWLTFIKFYFDEFKRQASPENTSFVIKSGRLIISNKAINHMNTMDLDDLDKKMWMNDEMR